MRTLLLAGILSLIYAPLYFLQLQQAYAPSEWDQLIDLSHLHPTSGYDPAVSRAGTISMKSKVSSVVPIQFSTSGTCPALTNDFASLVNDVGQSMIRSHRENPDSWPPIEQFQESVITLVEDFEFGLSLDVIFERRMGNAEFAELVGLLAETIKKLSEATGNIAFEAAKLTGVHKGVAFQAWWTWYSIANGVAGPCEGIARIPGYHGEL